jgi:hypothetical protein
MYLSCRVSHYEDEEKGVSMISSPLMNKRDIENQFRNSKSIFFISEQGGPEYYRYLCEIAWIANSVSGEIQIVRYNTPRDIEIQKFQTTFLQKLTNILPTVSLIDIPARLGSENRPDRNYGIKTLKQAFEHNTSLGHSIVSTLMSSLVSVPKPKSKRLSKVISHYATEFIQSETVCNFIISEIKPDFLIIPNGRFPDQAGLRAIAEKSKTPFLIFERGTRGNGRFHLQPHQTQDFNSVRRYYWNYFNSSRIESAISLDDSKHFLELQKNDSRFNPFAKRWAQSPTNGDSQEETNLCVFFTSSTDERYSNLGIDMNGWNSQEEAIIQTHAALKRSGFDFLVRIHPNAGWKTWNELRRMSSVLRKNRIGYVLPWEVPGTYELLQKVSLAATWGSTVCIEATALGIPTINLGRTPYDNVIDVLVVTPNNINTINFNQVPKPVASKSIRFFNARLQYGFQVEHIDFDERFNEIKELLAPGNFPVDSNISFSIRLKSMKKYLIQPQYTFLITNKLLGYKSSVSLMRSLISLLSKLPTPLALDERLK